MSAMNVKKGDLVEVTRGKSKGHRGNVIKSCPSTERVFVKGANMQHKSMRPTQANQQGGFAEAEGSLHVSSVKLVCPKCDKATRVGHGKNKDGKKVRICKKCGAEF